MSTEPQLEPDHEPLEGNLDEVMMRCLRGEIFPQQVVWKWARERLEVLEEKASSFETGCASWRESAEKLEKKNDDLKRQLTACREQLAFLVVGDLASLPISNMTVQRGSGKLRKVLLEAMLLQQPIDEDDAPAPVSFEEFWEWLLKQPGSTVGDRIRHLCRHKPIGDTSIIQFLADILTHAYRRFEEARKAWLDHQE